MLEKVMKKEYERIEKDAAEQKKAVDFIVNYINSNYKKLETIFRQKKNKTDKEKKLYGKTKSMLDLVESEATRYIGIVVCTSKTPLSPEMKAGLMKYEELGENFTPRITSKGKEIINEYRKARGLRSIGDCLKTQSRYWKRG